MDTPVLIDNNLRDLNRKSAFRCPVAEHHEQGCNHIGIVGTHVAAFLMSLGRIHVKA